MTQKSDIFENDSAQFGVLEGLFTPTQEALSEGDYKEVCLYVYANNDRPMTVEEIVGAVKQEFRNNVTPDQTIQAISRMVSSPELVKPGLIKMGKTEDKSKNTYQITESGYAYLWDKLYGRTPDNVLDGFGQVIALNKKLNSPERLIESHDLYALSLLAVLRLDGQASSTADVRKVLEKWIKPSGINAEILESERKNASPMNRFQRKFHNMFSSHNHITKEGLIQAIEDKEGTVWKVTTKGKALLMKRTFKEKRNLTLQMQLSRFASSMEKNDHMLSMLNSYEPKAETEQEQRAFRTLNEMMLRQIENDRRHIMEISKTLGNPETAAPAYRKKPKI